MENIWFTEFGTKRRRLVQRLDGQLVLELEKIIQIHQEVEIINLGEKLPDPFNQIAIAHGLFKIFALDLLYDSLQELLRYLDPRLVQRFDGQLVLELKFWGSGFGILVLDFGLISFLFFLSSFFFSLLNLFDWDPIYLGLSTSLCFGVFWFCMWLF
jgi:hypothetical protein